MQKLIKNNEIIDDNWTVIEKGYEGELPNPQSLLPKEYFLANAEQLKGSEHYGVWLDSDEGPEELAPYLLDLTLIAINFPAFTDGRGYSYARLLRERFSFEGEIRAIGDVLHDQLFFLKRCGFSSFALREDANPEVAIAGLNDFSETYQAACDQREPLFLRR
jgi:uncharacterized protein (DUF934 family)